MIRGETCLEGVDRLCVLLGQGWGESGAILTRGCNETGRELNKGVNRVRRGVGDVCAK